MNDFKAEAMNRRRMLLATAGGALQAWLPAAQAQVTTPSQNWPERQVRLWLSQPAGSGADAMARLIGDALGRRWGQPLLVENRPGGQNAIGAQAAARSPPDGHNFYFATAAALVTNAYLFKNLPYDPRRDFVPVGMVGKVPFAISVNTASPLKSLAELVAQAKAQPGRLAVANEGPKTFSGIMTRLLGAQLGIEVNAVTYASVSAGVTDTVAGHTEVIVSDLPSAAPMVKSGRLRLLAVTTGRRVPGWDHVPAIAETLPGFDHAGWIGIVAPTGTPAAAVQRLNRDLDLVLGDKDIAARLLAIGPVTEGAGTPEQMTAFLQAEHQRWAKLAKDIDLLPD